MGDRITELDTAVAALQTEMVPPDHSREQRHRTTREHDMRLCQRTCDLLVVEDGTHPHVEHEYVGAVCDWQPQGIRRCDCQCGMEQQTTDSNTWEGGVITQVTHTSKWVPVVAQVRESR